MGLPVDIVKHARGGAANGGISERVNGLTLINVAGPFDPTPESPAAVLQPGALAGIAIVVPVDVPEAEGSVGPMFGGCFVHSCDGRFSRAVEAITGARFYGAVALHDRWESPELYRAMSV